MHLGKMLIKKRFPYTVWDILIRKRERVPVLMRRKYQDPSNTKNWVVHQNENSCPTFLRIK